MVAEAVAEEGEITANIVVEVDRDLRPHMWRGLSSREKTIPRCMQLQTGPRARNRDRNKVTLN